MKKFLSIIAIILASALFQEVGRLAQPLFVMQKAKQMEFYQVAKQTFCQIQLKFCFFESRLTYFY